MSYATIELELQFRNQFKVFFRCLSVSMTNRNNSIIHTLCMTLAINTNWFPYKRMLHWYLLLELHLKTEFLTHKIQKEKRKIQKSI